MSSITITGSVTGAAVFTIQAPATATNRTITLPDVAGSLDVFPSGTVMVFHQTAAPTGWTKSTTHDNKALRVVSGTVGSGGTVAFTTAFASQAVAGTVGATTLTEAQMPSHSHSGSTSVNGAHSHFVNLRYAGGSTIDGAFSNADPGRPVYTDTQGSHSHTISASGSSSSHNHTFTGTAINLAVQYVDIIIASKN
jgi:hypothetical protein